MRRIAQSLRFNHQRLARSPPGRLDQSPTPQEAEVVLQRPLRWSIYQLCKNVCTFHFTPSPESLRAELDGELLYLGRYFLVVRNKPKNPSAGLTSASPLLLQGLRWRGLGHLNRRRREGSRELPGFKTRIASPGSLRQAGRQR